ncbi:MAG: hypothetical protein CTY18_01145 [Methylomonas sp.]|nr:MAG: hypothetical protein CTY18_01145 [Methylomonas sp.]
MATAAKEDLAVTGLLILEQIQASRDKAVKGETAATQILMRMRNLPTVEMFLQMFLKQVDQAEMEVEVVPPTSLCFWMTLTEVTVVTALIHTY